MKKIISLLVVMSFFFLLIPNLPARADGVLEMQGEAPPIGTTITGVSHPSTPASNAIDGDLISYWDSGSTSGSLELVFPTPVTMSAVQVAANAFPAGNEQYTIFGLIQGNWKQISNPTTAFVNWDSQYNPTILEPIPVDAGLYNGIRIQVQSTGSSWVAISEIRLINKAKACVGMEGFMFPVGTITSGNSYPANPSSNVLDCDLKSSWNSGSYGGSIELTFPNAIKISSLQIAAIAHPSSNEYYTIYGLSGHSWDQISSTETRFVNWDPQYTPTMLAPIDVSPDTYEAIRIEVRSPASWTAISEITYHNNSSDSGEEPEEILNKNLIPKIISPNLAIDYSNAWYGEGYLSFDGIDNHVGWSPISTQNQWLSYKFAKPLVINKYTIKPVNHPVGPSRAPRDWRFEGYNGIEWVTLDERTDITSWQAAVANEYIFSNSIAYKKYRIYVLNNNGDVTHLSIGDLEMMKTQ